MTLVVGGTNASTTYNGNLSGVGSITKTGQGTLTLGLAGTTSSFSGGITLQDGELSVTVDANLGSATNALTFNGGTLQVLAPL